MVSMLCLLGWLVGRLFAVVAVVAGWSLLVFVKTHSPCCWMNAVGHFLARGWVEKGAALDRDRVVPLQARQRRRRRRRLKARTQRIEKNRRTDCDCSFYLWNRSGGTGRLISDPFLNIKGWSYELQPCRDVT